MKKSLLTIAVAATMIAPAIAMADATLYGNVHLSINAADNDAVGAGNDLQMSSNTSAIGVKGSEDLGDGVKAIYKLEFGVDILGKPTTFPDTTSANGYGGTGSAQGTGTLTGRDQFVGLKGGMGTVKFGTMSSNYKQMGSKVDPLYRTPLEGRGFLGTQSALLHGGRGITRGRSTNTIQYSSPKMSGLQAVVNTTVSGSKDETSGIGVRWANKNILAYLDYIDNSATGDAIKVGGKYHAKAFSAGLQYEMLEDAANNEADIIFLSGVYNINKNNAVILTAGQRSNDFAGGGSFDSDGVALAYNHKMSKMTNVYVGYGAYSDDGVATDQSMITAGIKKKF